MITIARMSDDMNECAGCGRPFARFAVLVRNDTRGDEVRLTLCRSCLSGLRHVADSLLASATVAQIRAENETARKILDGEPLRMTVVSKPEPKMTCPDCHGTGGLIVGGMGGGCRTCGESGYVTRSQHERLTKGKAHGTD